MHNIALVGFGLAGQAFHAPLIEATDGLHLASIVTSRKDEVATRYPEVQVCATIDEVLADPEIALVVIASPDEFHVAHALAALEAGKHVVIDKPFAPTVAEASAVAAEAKRCGLLLSIFQNRRWDGDFLTLRRLIANGELGDLRLLESRFDRFRPQVGTRWKDHRAGGVWMDLGPHLVDQALCLLGMPLAVTADLAILKSGGTAPDHAQVLLRYANCRVTLHMSQSLPDHRLRIAAHGTGGSFVKHGLDPQEDQAKDGITPGDPSWGIDMSPGQYTSAEGRISTVETERGNYPAFYEEVAAALHGKGPMPVLPEEAIAVMEIVEAGLRSNEERREIPLGQPQGA